MVGVETTTFAALADFPHPALVGVTGPDETLAVQGDEHERMVLASVTKPLTAWGALIAVDRGMISLDDPAGPSGATVRRLFDHTSGLGMEPADAQRTPGERRIYSNAGIDALAEHVSDTVGVPFSAWMAHEVTGPLGMSETDVSGRPSAAGISSIHDLLIFAREVLRPTLISEELRDLALAVSHGGLRGIVPGYGPYPDCVWGLGFELKGAKEPHWMGSSLPPETAGHFGAKGSFLFIDRSRDLAAAFLSGVLFDAHHKRVWPGLTDEIVARYGG